MKKYHIIFLCFGTALLFFFTGCKKQGKKVETSEVIANVKVMEIVCQEITETFRISAWIEAKDDIMLASEMGGVVEALFHKEGDVIKKGDVIAFVNLKIREASLNTADANLNLSKINYERQKELIKKELISQGQMDQHEAAYKIAKAKYEAALIQMNKAKITSPIDGIINRSDLDLGEIAIPGIPVLRIVNIDMVKALVDLPEKDIFDIRKNDEVKIQILSKPDKKFNGVISFIATAAEGISKTFRVNVLIKNPDHILRPGMLVNVVFKKPVKKNGVVIPQTAFFSKEGRNWVYLAQNGKAVERDVVFGTIMDREIQIMKGLKQGDKIIVMGQHNIMDGDKIRISEEIKVSKGENN